MLKSDWSTADEITYLAGIGSHRLAKYRRESAEAVLRGYLAAAVHRHDWGQMDQARVLMFARNQLRVWQAAGA